ncbi:eps_transp_fam, exopolysaccharide transport protein family [Methylophilaceae bacterium]
MIEKETNHSENNAKANSLPQKLSEVYGNAFLYESYSKHHSKKPSGFFTQLAQSALRNSRWIIFLIVLLLGTAFWMSVITPPIYQATAVLEFAIPYANEPSDDKTSSNGDYSINYISLFLQNFKSGNLAKALEQTLDPKMIGSLASKNDHLVLIRIQNTFSELLQQSVHKHFTNEATQFDALEKLTSALEVRQLPNSNLIEISVYGFDSKVASDTANKAAFAAVELIQEREYAANETMSAFYEKRMIEAKSQYEISENERNFFAISNNLMSPQQRAANLQSLQEAVKVLKQKVAVAENDYRNYQQDHTKIQSTLIDGLVNQKSAFEAEYQQKSAELKPMHPDMLSLADKINAISEQIVLQKSEHEGVLRRNYQQQNFLMNKAIEQLRQFESAAINFSPLDQKYRTLTQKAELARAMYDSLRHRYEHLKLTSNNSNRVMINQSIPSLTPLKTFKLVLSEYLLVSAVIGLVGALLIALLSIYHSRIHYSRRDIEDEHGIPVIATIPHAPGVKTVEQAFKFLASKLNEGLTGAYRIAANALYFSNEAGISRVFGITSADNHEGKTITACALAIEYAASGQRVLLVDMNLRNPMLHRLFNVENHHGLTNILIGNEAPINVTHETAFSNLYLICSGPTPANPMQLLANEKLTDFIEMAKQKFDMIILDCPAINIMDEMLLVGTTIDNLLICMRSAVTKKTSIRKAIKKMLGIKRVPTGFILTDQPGSFYTKFSFKNKKNMQNFLANSPGSLLSK